MPECLDGFSWRLLKACGSMAPTMFKVGDYKNDYLRDGTPVQFRIIGFNHDKTSAGLVAPMTWEMVDCMPDRYPWNSDHTTEGSWAGTLLRRMMNDLDGTVYNLLPKELVDIVTPVVKLTADTYNGKNNIIETEDKFWIKSEKETFGRCFFSAPGEGSWYEWYRLEDTPWYKLHGGIGGLTMLRSPHCCFANSFCFLDPDGIASWYGGGVSLGLAPAFCI